MQSLRTEYQLRVKVCWAARAQTAITRVMLKMAEPMTPLMPMSSLATNTPITAVANSGPEEPAAMKVAPATSGGRFRTGYRREEQLYRLFFGHFSATTTNLELLDY